MAKPFEKISAINLRKQGLSIREIATKLGVSVSSVSTWCQDIVLSPTQIEILEKRLRDPYYGKRADYLKRLKDQTQEKIFNLKSEGLKKIGPLNEREIFIAGVALYWAEGFKKDKQIGFANMDPKMIQFFIFWLQKCLKVSSDDIKLRVLINIAYQHNNERIQAYWQKITGIPAAQFQKTIFIKTKSKKKYENIDNYYGILRIRVHKSLSELRRIFGYIEGLHQSNLDD